MEPILVALTPEEGAEMLKLYQGRTHALANELGRIKDLKSAWGHPDADYYILTQNQYNRADNVQRKLIRALYMDRPETDSETLNNQTAEL